MSDDDEKTVYPNIGRRKSVAEFLRERGVPVKEYSAVPTENAILKPTLEQSAERIADALERIAEALESRS